ncbi:hypothetical protein M8745_19095, partial [Lutimaribacter sp. EGI FJ00014]|nr:hypothetical protein [Lutimaribacter sp. EGI FJ00014]
CVSRQCRRMSSGSIVCSISVLNKITRPNVPVPRFIPERELRSGFDVAVKGCFDSKKGSFPMATTTRKSRKTEGKMSVSTSDIEDDIRQLRADVGQLMTHLKEMGGQTGPAARRAASDGLDQLRAQGEAAMENVKGSAEELGQGVSQMVRDRPFSSLLLAGGLGFLLALATRR